MTSLNTMSNAHGLMASAVFPTVLSSQTSEKIIPGGPAENVMALASHVLFGIIH